THAETTSTIVSMNRLCMDIPPLPRIGIHVAVAIEIMIEVALAAVAEPDISARRVAVAEVTGRQAALAAGPAVDVAVAGRHRRQRPHRIRHAVAVRAAVAVALV